MVAIERNGKETLYGKHGALRVSGSKLVGKSGEVVQLKGVSTHNMNSFPGFINDDAIEYMADNWGMQLFRLAMYAAKADGDFGYADGTDEHRLELEEMVLRSVKKCAELGIYCMVDWHILFDYNPNMNKDMAIKFFDKMAALLKDYDNVLYEICNEPSMFCDWYELVECATNEDAKKGEKDVCTWEDITSYANEVIPVIRKHVPNAVIVCGTPIWSQRVNEAADAPLKFDNVMYALHFYATTHKQDLRDIATYAINKGVTPYITEYGICDASGNGTIDWEEVERWMSFINENKISYTIWNLSNKDETSAMIDKDCNKLSGWEYNELSVSGKWFVDLQ